MMEASSLLFSSGANAVNTEDTNHPNDKLVQLLRDNQIDLNVVEGCGSFSPFEESMIPATAASSSNSLKGLQNSPPNFRRFR